MAKSSIEWTTYTWSPTVGCTRVSAGCEHCYAELMAHRLEAMGRSEYAGTTKVLPDGSVRWTGQVNLLKDRVTLPMRWRKPKRIFVDSMSDLFHETVPDWFIFGVWRTMAMTPQHIYQILTKRPERMLDWFAKLDDPGDASVTFVGSRDGTKPGFPNRMSQAEADRVLKAGRARMFYEWSDHLGEPGEGEARPGEARPTYDWEQGPRWWPTKLSNVWWGVSVEDQASAESRIPLLLRVPATVRFLSCEPLIGPVNLNQGLWGYCPEHDNESGFCEHAQCRSVQRLGWVIIGGESGPGARPFHLDWARRMMSQCDFAGVPVFVKQLGSKPRVGSGIRYEGMRDGGHHGDMDEWPEDMRVRRYPSVRPSMSFVR